MNNKLNSIPPQPQNSPSPEQPTFQAPKRRIGKKLYAAIAGVTVIVIVAVALLVPQGAAIIPLNVNYSIGEKMVYNTSMTMNLDPLSSALSQSGQSLFPYNNASITATQIVEVVGYDSESECYTLNHTMSMPMPTNQNSRPITASFLEKINKTGYSSYVFGSQEFSSSLANPYLSVLLDKPEVRVGDTWTVPFPGVSNSSSLSTTGELTMTFRGFEDLTVAAGTYRVFRVDISGNYAMKTSVSLSNASQSIEGSSTMSGTMYTEYGTLRQIKYTMQGNTTAQSSYMNYTIGMSMQMELVEHTKP